MVATHTIIDPLHAKFNFSKLFWGMLVDDYYSASLRLTIKATTKKQAHARLVAAVGDAGLLLKYAQDKKSVGFRGDEADKVLNAEVRTAIVDAMWYVPGSDTKGEFPFHAHSLFSLFCLLFFQSDQLGKSPDADLYIMLLRKTADWMESFELMLRAAIAGPESRPDLGFANIDELEAAALELRSDVLSSRGLSCETPYLHFWCVHIGDILRRHGPLHDFSCEKLEAKNKVVQNAVSGTVKGGSVCIIRLVPFCSVFFSLVWFTLSHPPPSARPSLPLRSADEEPGRGAYEVAAPVSGLHYQQSGCACRARGPGSGGGRDGGDGGTE